MSYRPIQDDGQILSNTISKNKITFAPELSQGRKFLKSKQKMCKSIRRRNNKIEGFDNMGLSNSLQEPVKLNNNDEIQQLVTMQNSYDKTMDMWQSKYKDLLSQVDNNKGLYQQCLDACKKHKDRDLLTACIYGCTSGKYISSGAAYRGPPAPPLGVFSILEALGSAVVVAGILAGAVLAGPELLAIAAALAEAGEFAEMASAAAELVSAALSAAVEAGTTAAIAVSDALSALTICGPSMFGFSLDAAEFAEIFGWVSGISEADCMTIASMSFILGGATIGGLALYEQYKKTCGFSENFEDLSLANKRNVVMFLRNIPGAPRFEEIATPSAQSKLPPKPVNKNLIYYKGKEGFSGSPQAHSISSVSGKNENIYQEEGIFQQAQMGDYGPAGYKFKGKDKRNEFKKMINKKLSSNPELPGNAWLTGDGAKESATTTSEIDNVNPDGLRATMTKATDAFSTILKGLPNDPLIVQMKKADIGPDNLTETIQQLENQWRDIFDSVCEAGIKQDSEGKFAGHQQYCKSWTNMGEQENRSGYYGQLWTGDSYGNKIENGLVGKTFNLSNNSDVGSNEDKENGRSGCDIVIPSTRNSADNIGGAGYCTCVDGSTIYMDNGHPNITCNDLCYPKNIKNPGKKNLFYHDSSQWIPSVEAIDGKKGPSAFGFTPPYSMPGAEDPPWLHCGDNGGEPDQCANGMKQLGNVERMKECGSYLDRSKLPWEEQIIDDIDKFFGAKQEYPPPQYANLGRKCVYALPPGGDKPYVGPKQVEDNGFGAQIPVGYAKLASQDQLVNSCGNSKYPNLYIEILALRALEIILGNKTEVMAKVIQNSNDARVKTKLKQTQAGRTLLKSLQKYQNTYNNFQRNETKAKLLDGMVEDAKNKNLSANVNYYLWFALAISGMLIVIKNINK